MDLGVMHYILAVFLTTLTVVGSMYAPLSEITTGAADDQLSVCIQYLLDDMPMPVALQHSVAVIHRGASIHNLVQLLERSGCESNRLVSLLAVLRECAPAESGSARPPELGQPEDHPHAGHHASSSVSPGPSQSFEPSVAASSAAVPQTGTLAPGAPSHSDIGPPASADEGDDYSPMASSAAMASEGEELPPIPQLALSSSELESFRHLVLTAHGRLAALRGHDHLDIPSHQLAWLQTIRQFSFALQNWVAPLFPDGVIPDAAGVPVPPILTRPSPSLTEPTANDFAREFQNAEADSSDRDL
eukprot:s320_g26.t1